MKKYILEIYGVEERRVFDTEEEAESDMEYLERVQGKQCKIIKGEFEDEEK